MQFTGAHPHVGAMGPIAQRRMADVALETM